MVKGSINQIHIRKDLYALICMVGDVGVGKTSIVETYIKGKACL